RHLPPSALRIGAGHHLLLDLDEIEGHQDLVDGNQLVPVLAVEVRLALLRGEGEAAIGRFLAPVRPDRVGVEEPDALQADDRRELGDDAVPVPEPSAPSRLDAGSTAARRGRRIADDPGGLVPARGHAGAPDGRWLIQPGGRYVPLVAVVRPSPCHGRTPGPSMCRDGTTGS